MSRSNVILTADVLLETDVIQLAAEFIMSCYDYYMYYIECESADIVNYICFKTFFFSFFFIKMLLLWVIARWTDRLI